MKLNIFGGVLAVTVAVLLFVAYLSLFTVHQTQLALVLQVGEPRAVGDGKIGPRHFNRDDCHFGIAGGNLSRGKVACGNVVVIPEIEVDNMPAREKLPHLRRKNTEVRARVGGQPVPSARGSRSQARGRHRRHARRRPSDRGRGRPRRTLVGRPRGAGTASRTHGLDVR